MAAANTESQNEGVDSTTEAEKAAAGEAANRRGGRGGRIQTQD